MSETTTTPPQTGLNLPAWAAPFVRSTVRLRSQNATWVVAALAVGCFSEPTESSGNLGDTSGSTSTTHATEHSSPQTASTRGSTTATSAGASEGTDAATGDSSEAPACDALFEFLDECTDEPAGMAVVANGDFEMGCDQKVEVGACDDDEFPVHQVQLTTFAIDMFEVTVGAYDACLGDGGCTPRGDAEGCNLRQTGDDEQPANCVTWQQAADFCEWRGKRLPTEAEWEYAAEGPENNRWPWGDEPNPNCDLAVIVGPRDVGCDAGRTLSVGSKPDGASSTGALDMTGNVAEWVADWWSPTGYEDHDPLDPLGPGTGEQKVTRGASLVNGVVASLRIRNRVEQDPNVPDWRVGFRCSLSAR
ncbi:MAG: SUMF1/EgtB/PvdO family nonheme iron enzyme [Nannocystales bacterium]